MNIKLSLNAPVREQEGLQQVLEKLTRGVREILADNYVGAYLQGSLATGDFDNHSDVDFLVVTEESPSRECVDALQEFHRSMFEFPCYWAHHLEGSYVPRIALQELPPPRRKLLYLDHGHRTFEYSDHDHYLAVLWILRERGVTLDGPPPESLVAFVSGDALREEVASTMHEWGSTMLNDPNEMPLVWSQAFAVLSYCRMAESIFSGEIHSKAYGCRWAKTTMDSFWHGLIDTASAQRRLSPTELMKPVDPELRVKTLSFVQYVLEHHTS